MSIASLEIALSAEHARVTTPGSVDDEVLRLFDACAPRIRRYVRYCGVTPDVAEDIVQETFVALFHHLRRGGSRENLPGWLMRVSYRQALRHRRALVRRSRWLRPWHEDAAEVPAGTGDPEAECMARGDQARLRKVLKALPERDRQCIYLRAEGLRYREIADVLGVSLGSVAKSLARAMGRLSAAIGNSSS